MLVSLFWIKLKQQGLESLVSEVHLNDLFQSASHLLVAYTNLRKSTHIGGFSEDNSHLSNNSL